MTVKITPAELRRKNKELQARRAEKNKGKPSKSAAAAAHLAALDKQRAAEEMKRKKAVLRTKVQMGDRATRRKAASELSNLPGWKRVD